MIKKLLIANRGEIACRIIKTAKEMGIETYSIFSEADNQSLAMRMADHAICVGPPPSSQSYLRRDKIIEIALLYQIDAIHPGYGFLAEDSEFARLCAENKIIFVGPPAKAIAAMGDKALAKEIMHKANVPVVPGYQGAQQDLATLVSAAEKMGYPILIKASAGGGGKGMRLVTDPKKFKNALTEAKQEAKASFDNDQVLLEKYLLPARHVEVQIFSDQTGQTVYLFDRDCSIQRRHQKIIEEAPAPNLPQTLRDKMGQTAVLAAKAINYVGAGTIEFLVTPKNEFYFMEMNTRLQVEHPVTESITGLDLVAWQLKIASGECLPLKQNEIQNYGHAIEARIYAENPQQNFMPSIGHLEVLHFPIEHARIDSGVTQGDNITPYYDPLIAKIITWAETRELAIAKLKEALSQTYIIGVENNIQYLSSLLKQPDFIAANLQTRFIEEHQNSLLPSTDKLAPHILALATIAELHARELNAKQVAQQSNDASSPWNYRDHWRLNSEVEQILQFWHLNQHYKIRAQQKHDCIIMDNLKVQVHWKNNFELLANINDQSYPAAVFHKKEIIHLFYQGEHYKISLNNPKTYVTHLTSQQAQFISPMPSTVVDICVAPGQEVNAGDKLMVLEAMKMQHTIFAPEAGKIKTINYQIGDLLPEGVTLLEFEN